MKKELSNTSYIYRKLKEIFPKEETFFELYDSGDYYNTAKTHYYTNDGKEIYISNHGYYG